MTTALVEAIDRAVAIIEPFYSAGETAAMGFFELKQFGKLAEEIFQLAYTHEPNLQNALPKIEELRADFTDPPPMLTFETKLNVPGVWTRSVKAPQSLSDIEPLFLVHVNRRWLDDLRILRDLAQREPEQTIETAEKKMARKDDTGTRANTPVGNDSSEYGLLTDNQYQILSTLGRAYPKQLPLNIIADDTELNRRTVSDVVGALKKRKLVIYDSSKRQGAGITLAGRNLLSEEQS